MMKIDLFSTRIDLYLIALAEKNTMSPNDSASRSITGKSASGHNPRVHTIIQVRWLVLLIIFFYSIISAWFLQYTTKQLTVTPVQLWSILGLFCAVALYNILIQLINARAQTELKFARTQIILDMLITTMIIHLTGGGSSWLWPIYLVISLEAAFLFQLRRFIVITCMINSTLFALVLWAGYHNILAIIDLDLFSSPHKNDPQYLILLWFWVSILNVTATIVGLFFNHAITAEAREVTSRENRLQNFMENAQDLILAFDENKKIHYVNKVVMERLSIDDNNNLPTIEQLIVTDDKERWDNKTCLLGIDDSLESEIFRLLTNDGESVPVDCRISSDRSGKNPLHWMVCRDLSEKIKSEQRLHHIANHDQLTDLANRHSFVGQAQHSIRLARRAKQQIAVAIIAIDHLKIINETLNSARGDILLCAFSDRLLESVRETDIVGRLAGNQFAILLDNVDGCPATEQVVEKIRKNLASPITIDQHELFVTASIGLSMYPQDGSNIEDMIKNASNATNSVKAHGGNSYSFYSSEMDDNIKNRLEMINGLHQALAKNELQLHYQPKVHIATGKFHTVEALLRWRHPTLGQVGPAEFIPMAEEAGVIGDLTLWVLQEACRQSKEWQDHGLPPIRIAVNVSGHQLQSRDLIRQVKTVLAESKIDPQLLEIEVTESILMQNPEAAIAILTELHDCGIHLSIDDFGTGYSSLAYLKNFPINSLKIDRTFIQDIEKSDKYASITSAIIDMGKILNLNIIAEGVETLGQMAFLKDHKCDEVQGYLYSKPVPPQEIAALLDNLKDQTHPISRLNNPS